MAPLAIVASTTALAGCIEERVVYAPAIPDQDAAEIVEVSPGPDAVYVSGHWDWNGNRYVWVRAHYLHRPHPNLYWVEAHWQTSPRGWYWQEGHWVDAKTLHAHHPYHPRVVTQPTPAPVEGELQVDPNVPPAPTYAPPPPPANIPPPPGGAVVPQRYGPDVGY